MKLKCPLLLNMHLKKNQQNYWSFYPSEPFKNEHFNVRHPVSRSSGKKNHCSYIHCCKLIRKFYYVYYITYSNFTSILAHSPNITYNVSIYIIYLWKKNLDPIWINWMLVFWSDFFKRRSIESKRESHKRNLKKCTMYLPFPGLAP